MTTQTENTVMYLYKMWIRCFNHMFDEKTQEMKKVYGRSCALYNSVRTPELFTLVIYDTDTTAKKTTYHSLTFEYAKALVKTIGLDYTNEFFAVVAKTIPITNLDPALRAKVGKNMLTMCPLPTTEENVQLDSAMLYLFNDSEKEIVKSYCFTDHVGRKTYIKKDDDVVSEINGSELFAVELWAACKEYFKEHHNNQNSVHKTLFSITDDIKLEKIRKRQQILSEISKMYPLRFRY